MATVLIQAGFIVETCEEVHCPTPAMGDDVKSWVRLFGAAFLDKVEEWVNAREAGDSENGKRAREDVVREVSEVVEGVGRRGEDGAFVIGHVRLRIQARKPK